MEEAGDVPPAARERVSASANFERREKTRSGATAPLPGRGRGRSAEDSGSCRYVGSGPRGRNTKRLGWIFQSSLQRTAAAYSPTWWGSTIGDGGLNFSVRNGKRWYPAAIATAVCYLREITSRHSCQSTLFSGKLALTLFFCNSFSQAIFLLRKDFGLLVQVD